MKELQKKVAQFCRQHDLNSSTEVHLLDLVSEVGEVSKEMLKMTNYGKGSMQLNDCFVSELGDVLYSLITVANSCDVDLEEALFRVIKKYERRIKKGSPGSENDEDSL